MAEVYPTPVPRHLRIVKDEDAPTYDGQPIRRQPHRTMIEDDAVMAAARCGQAAAGLYMVLERLVGPDGSWTCTNGDLAAMFECSVHHVRDSAKTLEDAGLITRETTTNGRGFSTGVRWFLPRHRTTNTRTNGADLTPDLTPDLSCALDKVVVATVATVATRTEPNGSGEAPKSKRRKGVETDMPDDFAPTEKSVAWAKEKYGYSDADLVDRLDRMRTYVEAHGKRYVDWQAAWRTFMTPKPWEAPPLTKPGETVEEQQRRRFMEALGA